VAPSRTNSHARRFARWLLVAATCAWSSSAVAQDEESKGTARQLFFEASKAMTAEDYARAADLFARSNALYPAPTAALGEARALAKLGRLVAAHERYNAIVRGKLADKASDAFKEASGHAREEVAALKPRIPGLVIQLDRATEAEIMVDDRKVPRAAFGVRWLVDPGERHVRATAEGFAPFEETVTVAEGETKTVRVKLEPLPDQPRPPAKAPTRKPDTAPGDTGKGDGQRIAGWVLVGAGGASLVVAAVTGGLFVHEKGQVEDACDGQNRCTQDGLDALDRGRMYGIVNTVTLFAGVALAGAGITVVLTAPDGTDSAWLGPAITTGGAGLSLGGRW
jgi:hypothetical protein